MQITQWAPVVVGTLATVGVLATLWQRQRSEQHDRRQRAEHDARAEWWKRYQWAAEQATKQDNPRAEEFGRTILGSLADSPLVTTSELTIIRSVAGNRSIGHNESKPTEGDAHELPR